MDKIDKYIIDDLSQDIKLPQSYQNIISNTLKNKQITKKYRLKKLIHTIITSISSLILFSGMAFAGYTVYEKVWKEPQSFNSLEERIEYDREFSQKNTEEKINKNKIMSIEEAISISSDIFKNLEIEQNITTENIKINSEQFASYFEIETNEYTMSLTPNGVFRYLMNKKFNYNAKDNIIDESTALELSNKIINCLNLNNNYSLNFIEYTNGFIKNDSYNIWMASYYETINGLENKYNCINIFFSIIDNNMVIERISKLDDNWEFQNNEVIIEKEKSIEIAQSADRKISMLDISAIDAELAIERINSFVYAQEKTLGKEDEYKYEDIDGGTNIYNAYSNEKILRTIWKVKIDYNYNDDNARNSNESRGRYYYVDATTGEIIGGSWGQIGY